jgi:hypothetical protein
MELDHQRLQLLFNVIAITAVTSLTLVWYLRKRDREALANRLIAQRTSAKLREQSVPGPVEKVSIAVPAAVTSAAPAVVPAAQRVALPAVKAETRRAASRQDAWMAPSVAQWNQRLSSRNQPSQESEPGHVHKELPHSQRIMFPRHQPSTPGIQRLAGPLDLCGTMAAANYGRLSR